MTNSLTQNSSNQNGISQLSAALLKGDLRQLNDLERVKYYNSVCSSVGLNPLTKPLEYMELNGKVVLYATKSCTDQLRSIHSISVKVTAREKIDTVYVVTVDATSTEGRVDSSTGAVSLLHPKTGQPLTGEALANALMKAETKAKRRVTLSICGLSLLSEDEVETIPGVTKTVFPDQPQNGLDGSTEPTHYKIPFGKYAQRSLEEVGPEKLIAYVNWLEDNAAAKNKPLDGKALEFVDRASAFIAAFENSPIDGVHSQNAIEGSTSQDNQPGYEGYENGSGAFEEFSSAPPMVARAGNDLRNPSHAPVQTGLREPRGTSVNQTDPQRLK